jgi:hypothetical protein
MADFNAPFPGWYNAPADSPSEPWTLEASLVIEAGQLEAVSRDIADFFGESGV